MKYIRLLHVKEDIGVIINIDKNIITVKNRENEMLFYTNVEDNKQINSIITNLINNHFSKGYVITSITIFEDDNA